MLRRWKARKYFVILWPSARTQDPSVEAFNVVALFYIITIFIGFLFHANKRPICWGPCCSRGLRLSQDNTHMGSKGFVSRTHTHVNIHTSTLQTNRIQPRTFFQPAHFYKLLRSHFYLHQCKRNSSQRSPTVAWRSNQKVAQGQYTRNRWEESKEIVFMTTTDKKVITDSSLLITERRNLLTCWRSLHIEGGANKWCWSGNKSVTNLTSISNNRHVTLRQDYVNKWR